MLPPTKSRGHHWPGGAVFLRLAAAALLVVSFSGCLSMKSYVDPSFRGATLQSLKPADQPVPVVLDVAFQTNGTEKPRVKTLLRGKVYSSLVASHLLSEEAAKPGVPAAHLKVTVNNVGDVSKAVGKGFGTGLTLGLVGSEVIDGYEMTAEYTPPGGTAVTKTYRHAIHSTIGAHAPPPGMTPVSLEEAFTQVVNDMLLNFLRDLQAEHLL